MENMLLTNYLETFSGVLLMDKRGRFLFQHLLCYMCSVENKILAHEI